MEELKFNQLRVLDIGNTLELSGVSYSYPNGETILILLPDEKVPSDLKVLTPCINEWSEIVRQSDLKEVEIVGDDKDKKIILRKSTRQIDQKIMWEVFRRDGYTCQYCGNARVPLTVDHVVLWEEGGPSIPINLMSSCKKCNNARGNMQFEDWLKSEDYEKITEHTPYAIVALHKDYFLRKIPEIRANHMRVQKRSR